MRTIKLRGKDISGKWQYFTFGEDDILKLLFLKPESTSAYIGIKDSDGTEIFEGDVLETRGKNYVYKALVVYQEDLAAYFLSEQPKEFRYFWNLYMEMEEGATVKVIGNIFDDPDLDEEFGDTYRGMEKEE